MFTSLSGMSLPTLSTPFSLSRSGARSDYRHCSALRFKSPGRSGARKRVKAKADGDVDRVRRGTMDGCLIYFAERLSALRFRLLNEHLLTLYRCLESLKVGFYLFFFLKKKEGALWPTLRHLITLTCHGGKIVTQQKVRP